MTQNPDNLPDTTSKNAAKTDNRGGKRINAGRPKGSLGYKNKRIIELLGDLGVKPVHEYIDLLRNSDQFSDHDKAAMLWKLIDKSYPSLKSIEAHTSLDGNDLAGIIREIQSQR